MFLVYIDIVTFQFFTLLKQVDRHSFSFTCEAASVVTCSICYNLVSPVRWADLTSLWMTALCLRNTINNKQWVNKVSLGIDCRGDCCYKKHWKLLLVFGKVSLMLLLIIKKMHLEWHTVKLFGRQHRCTPESFSSLLWYRQEKWRTTSCQMW